MLLDDLVKVIETLKERIASHGPARQQNETRTRMALIDPLLQALGWDTSEPAVVRPEYSAGNGRADYALLGETRNPVAFIEAKRLSEPLEKPNTQDQVFTYALVQQVKYAGLTDGNRWILDNVSVFSGERRVLDISLSETPTHEAALKLLLLWRPNLASGQPVEANAPELVGVRPLQHSTTTVAQETGQNNPGNWISLSNVAAGTGQKPPKAIRFSTGQVRNIPSWRQILVEVAEKLANDGTLTATHCPMKGLGFINSSPNGPGGVSFRSYKTISGGLYVNLNWNASNIIKHSRRLLSHFHLSPETVELQFD